MMTTPSIRLQNYDNALSHRDIEHIARNLGKASESGNGWTCLCPAHNDHSPSLSLSLGSDGKLLLSCFTGCSFEDVLREIKDRGLLSNQNNASRFCEPKAANTVRHEKISPIIPLEYDKKLRSQAQPSAVAPIFPVPEHLGKPDFKLHGRIADQLFAYHNAQGQLDGYMGRWNLPEGKKVFRPILWCKISNGRPKWFSQGFPEPRPLYNLHLIAADANKGKRSLIVEGEKAADAAQILFPDMICTTTMHGAQSPQNTDFGPLKDRSVILALDNDQAGKEYGEKVAKLCREAGVLSISQLNLDVFEHFCIQDDEITDRTEELPEGYDLADALAEGWTASFLEKFEKNDDTPLFVGVTLPPENTLSSKKRDSHAKCSVIDGVLIWHNGNIEKVICNPAFEVVAHTVNEDGTNAGRLIAVTNTDGKKHTFFASMRDLSNGAQSKVIADLSDKGCFIPSARGSKEQLVDCIKSFPCDKRMITFSQMGWRQNNTVFVTSAIIFSTNDSDEFLYVGSSDFDVEVSGTHCEWKDRVGIYFSGNHFLIAGAGVAFSAILRPFLPKSVENRLINFQGPSRSGKTACLAAITSIMGAPAYMQSFRSTSNGLEGLLEVHNHVPVVIDEFGQCSESTIREIGYLMQGRGKARKKQDGTALPITTWQNNVIGSGEKTLLQMCTKIRKQVEAGESQRFIDLPIDEMGAFQNLHQMTGASLANLLKENSSRYYGTPFLRFIQKLLEELTTNGQTVISSKLNELMEEFIQVFSEHTTHGQQISLVTHWASYYAAAALAQTYGIFPDSITKDDVFSSVAWCCKKILDTRDEESGNLPYEIGEGCKQLYAWFAVNQGGFSSIDLLTSGSHPLSYLKQLGYYRTDKSNKEFLISCLSRVLEDEVLSGFDAKPILQHLEANGAFIRGKRGKKGATQIRINECRVDCYVFDASLILNGGVQPDED